MAINEEHVPLGNNGARGWLGARVISIGSDQGSPEVPEATCPREREEQLPRVYFLLARPSL